MERMNITQAAQALRAPAASSPSPPPTMSVAAEATTPSPPPQLPDEIELHAGQAYEAMWRAKKVKFGHLQRAYRIWEQMNCDLVHVEDTGLWEYVPREVVREPAPYCPARVDDVELTDDEAHQALRTMQERIWGELNAQYAHYQAEQAARQREADALRPLSAQEVCDWAWREGQRICRQMQPPLQFGFAEHGELLFRLLSCYFAGDEDTFAGLGADYFAAIGAPLDANLNLYKGLAFIGPKGVGKSLMLATFQRNRDRPYGLVSAKRVEMAFRAGDKGRQQQELFCGVGRRDLCVDDVCTEEVTVKDFGNPENPMARVILERFERYQKGQLPRWSLHLSSNNPLHRGPGMPSGMKSWEELYGDRAVDRLYELCNIIPFVGNSRRG